MHKPLLKLAALALPTLVGLQGCHISQTTIGVTATCPVDGPTAGNCTIAGSTVITLVPNAIMQTVGVDDLTSVTDGSYTVSASVPSASFSADPNGVATTTLTANTDTGYSSSITVSLNPTTAAISPVNSGDAVFSYNLPNTTTFNNWVQQVASNTGSSMTLTSSAGLPLQATADPGTFTMSAVLTSNTTGTLGSGHLQLTRSTSSGGSCPQGRNNCNQGGGGNN